SSRSTLGLLVRLLDPSASSHNVVIYIIHVSLSLSLEYKFKFLSVSMSTNHMFGSIDSATDRRRNELELCQLSSWLIGTARALINIFRKRFF
ncbi:unnamed protein product, partial [Linum tenue]